MKQIKNAKLGLIFICFLLTLNNCTKISGPETDNNFVEGEILFSPNELVPLENLLSSLEEYNKKIELIYLYNYEYLIENPTFNQEYYLNIIDSKEYLKKGNLVSTVNTLGTKMKFKIRFFEIDNEKIMDWTETRDKLNLIHVHNGFEYGKLKVEIGTEIEWVEILSSNPHLKTVQLNHNNISNRSNEE